MPRASATDSSATSFKLPRTPRQALSVYSTSHHSFAAISEKLDIACLARLTSHRDFSTLLARASSTIGDEATDEAIHSHALRQRMLVLISLSD